MHDWNHDGKIDHKDRMMDYMIYDATSKKENSSDFSQKNGNRISNKKVYQAHSRKEAIKILLILFLVCVVIAFIDLYI